MLLVSVTAARFAGDPVPPRGAGADDSALWFAGYNPSPKVRRLQRPRASGWRLYLSFPHSPQKTELWALTPIPPDRAP